jgi:ABC-2 type transport system ATP-binding protein
VRSIIGRARDAGSTVFLNSHLLGEVERVCDRVAIVDDGRVLESGRLDDLVGDAGVRIRVTDLPAPALADLARFGSVVASDGWVSIAPIEPDAVPDVVAAIVGAGGRVHAVEVGRTTLEDRFLRLVGGASPASADQEAGSR